MNASKWGLAGGVVLLIAGVSHATTIHTYGTEFAGPTASTGWSYLCTDGTNAIGDSEHYGTLLWDSGQNQYDSTGDSSTWSNNGVYSWMRLSSNAVIPGYGTGQGAAKDVYDIAAYQVQAGEVGYGKITGSSLTTMKGVDDSGNINSSQTGLRVCVYVNDVVKNNVVIPVNSTGDFNCDLGLLSASDKIYVAVGANGDQWANLGSNFGYSIQITPVPEPATDMLLLGSAISGILAYAWKKRK